MKKLYEKLGLFETIVKSYPISKMEIVSIFKRQWDQDSGMELLDDLDKKRYKYLIDGNIIRIKERKKFEGSETRKTYLVGSVDNSDNSTKLKFKVYIKPLEFLLTTLSTLSIILIMVYGVVVLEGNSKLMLVILLMLSPVAYGRSLYEWTSALKKMKYEFERELDFILNKSFTIE